MNFNGGSIIVPDLPLSENEGSVVETGTARRKTGPSDLTASTILETLGSGGMMKLPQGKRAPVTRASSGIGLAFAEALAARGLHLVLVARSADKLNDLALRLARDHGVQAEVLVEDLERPGAAQRIHAAVVARGWTVDLLVNNAGWGKWGAFTDYDDATYASMVQVNVVALTELCRAFLPDLVAQKGLGVINVGSTGSLIPVPYAAVYAATKAYVISFTDGLYGEYADQGLHIMTLCPGGTATGFAAVAHAEVARRRGPVGSPASAVVADALKAFEAGKTYVVSTKDNWLTAVLLPRLLPRKTVLTMAGSRFKGLVSPKAL